MGLKRGGAGRGKMEKKPKKNKTQEPLLRPRKRGTKKGGKENLGGGKKKKRGPHNEQNLRTKANGQRGTSPRKS